MEYPNEAGLIALQRAGGKAERQQGRGYRIEFAGEREEAEVVRLIRAAFDRGFRSTVVKTETPDSVYYTVFKE